MSNEIAVTSDRSLAITVDIEELVGMNLKEVQELDFSCIPTIVNDGSMFKVKGTYDWEVSSKDGFDAIILSATPYAYYRCSDESHSTPGFYTYDKKTLRSGEPIETVLDTWESAGATWSVKDYIEVHLLMVDEGPAFNALAILTISPTSVKRFKSYLNITLKRQHKVSPHDVVTHFSLGDKLVSATNQKFQPTEASFKGYVTKELQDKILD